jgi:long-chain fatty acid transport protein
MRTGLAGISSVRLLGAGFLTAFSSTSLASGFALIEQSASQMGNAFAGGAAYANDASTIYFNPAGMTRLPAQLVGALHYVQPSAKFDGSATTANFGPPFAPPQTVTGGNGGDAGQPGFVPNLYMTAPLGNGLFAGLGINAPFGLSTEYDDDWKGRYHAIESELKTVNINPSIAYRVNRQWSFGAGFNLQYISAKLTQAIDQGSLCAPTQTQLAALGVPNADPALCAGQVPQGSDAFAKLEADNWAGGYNFGILYQPSYSTRVGFSYRSKIQQQVTGDGRFSGTIPQFSNFGIFVNTDVRADVNLPQTASLSVWHDYNDRWSVMADATWTGWDNFDELRIQYDSFQPDTVVDENWNDVWRYAVGVNYRYNSKWTFRAGTAYDQTPIPDAEHRTARIPGEDRTWLSLGFGYKFNPSLGVDVGYSHLFVLDDAKINNTDSNAGNLNGKYDAAVDILSAQVVWNI